MYIYMCVCRAPPRPAPTVRVADILKRPGRLKRPERIFIILRGLPGAGKTRVGRTLRDIEVACIYNCMYIYILLFSYHIGAYYIV